MTPTETVRLIALIAQLWPNMKINEYTAEAWHPIFEDLPLREAVDAVRSLSRASGGYIAPADIRREAARSAGLLPAPEAEALRMAARVAGDLGTGRGALPEPVRRAYDLMGGSQGFNAPESVTRPQFGRIYREVCDEYVRELLVGDLGHAIKSSERRELESGGNE